MSTAQLSPQQLRRALVFRLLSAVVFVGAILFLPAGTWNYWQAWLFMGVLFIPVLLLAGYLFWNDPELLERRMRMRERRTEQKWIMALSVVSLLGAFFLPGLDHRYSWSEVPAAVVILADLIFLLGYVLFALTLRENRYASRVIEVEAGQPIITSGPYAVVRHPLYLSALMMYMIAPLALGSYWALIPAGLLPVLLFFRIRNEEQMLMEELEGYRAYRQTVRYRLLPGIW